MAGTEVFSGHVDNKVSFVKLPSYVWMQLLKSHHVSEVNWKPPGVADIVVLEEVGDEFWECFPVHIKVSFPERKYQQEYDQLHVQHQMSEI